VLRHSDRLRLRLQDVIETRLSYRFSNRKGFSFGLSNWTRCGWIWFSFWFPQWLWGLRLCKLCLCKPCFGRPCLCKRLQVIAFCSLRDRWLRLRLRLRFWFWFILSIY
jgi:hypothetical protein